MFKRYTVPKLANHKVLYRGKRYWVFEISSENPFENMEDVCSIIVYDKFCAASAAYCTYSKDGKIVGNIPYSQQSIEIEGGSAREIASQVDYWTRWIEKTEK